MFYSPKQLYQTLDQMNQDYQKKQVEEQEKKDPSEGSEFHPDYGKETLPEDIKPEDIKF